MSLLVSEVLKYVGTGRTLNVHLAEDFMNELMSGNVTPVQTAAVLAALAVRGETTDEITGFARAMRSHSISKRLPFETIDTCGTGGDGASTFNISTATAIVCAAAGLKVAKHGNRAVSSKSGSADVLSALGARVDLDVLGAVYTLVETNLCFLFAPTFHPAMKYAAEARKQLGFRTAFNVLGPLTNPLQASRQVLGVYKPELVPIVAASLASLGTKHAFVVHGAGGIDEFSITGDSFVAEVIEGQVREFHIHPTDVGLRTSPLTSIVGENAVENARIITQVLEGTAGGPRDVVVYNSGAALYVGGASSSFADGVRLAQATIDSGRALNTLKKFVAATQNYSLSEVAQ